MPPTKPPLEDQSRQTYRPLGPDGKPIATRKEVERLLGKVALPLERFRNEMLRKFAARAYKGFWRKTGPTTVADALYRLKQEIVELEHAIWYEDAAAIQSEAADVANITLMVHEMAEDWIKLYTRVGKQYTQGQITEEQLVRALCPMVPAAKVPIA